MNNPCVDSFAIADMTRFRLSGDQMVTERWYWSKKGKMFRKVSVGWKAAIRSVSQI